MTKKLDIKKKDLEWLLWQVHTFEPQKDSFVDSVAYRFKISEKDADNLLLKLERQKYIDKQEYFNNVLPDNYKLGQRGWDWLFEGRR